MSCTERDFTCATRPTSTRAATTTPTAPPCSGLSAVVGPMTFTQTAAGCLSVARTNFAVADGAYANATVTMKDGHVIGVSAGTTAVLQAVAPLCTASTDTSTTLGTATVTLDSDPSNLSRLVGGALSTLVFAEGTNGVTVSGSGTAADPIVVTGPTIPAATVVSGVTLTSTYGIQFAAGLVKNWAAPVMGLTTGANSGITLVENPTTRSFDISLTPVTTTTTTTTTYAEPVGVTFNANTSAPVTSGVLSVYGRPDTTYLLEWKAGNMATGATYGTTTSFSVTTDSAGLYSAAYSSAPRAGLYSVTRNISGTNTVVTYVQV